MTVNHLARLLDGVRPKVEQAIYDPGATEGYKGDRSLTAWQTDAVMRAVLAALAAAHHVNETLKSEHDSADVLTALPAAPVGVCTWPSCGHTAKGQCLPATRMAALSAALPSDVAGVVGEAGKVIERLEQRDTSRHGYTGHPLYNRDGRQAADTIRALISLATAQAAQIAGLHSAMSEMSKTVVGLKAERNAAETALAAERAKVAKLVEKFSALEKAATEVSRRGAETGPQWTKLTIALLSARAALSEAEAGE